VVEGEIDALTVASFGINVLATTGIQKRDSVRDLGRFKTVYMNFDNESDPKVAKQVQEALKAFTRELRNLFPSIEIKIIKLPAMVKDVNEALQSGFTADDFKRWMTLAEDYLEGTVARSASFYFNDMSHYLTDTSKAQGLPTLIDGLDEALGGGERLGEIDALVAEAKTGKSSFFHQKIYQRIQAGIPVGYISRELSPSSEVLPNLFSIHFGVNFWKLDKLTEEERRTLLEDAQSVSGSWPLFFTNGYGNISMSDITQFVRECKAKGVNYFYLDHFHYCLDNAEDNKEISKFAKELKALVKEENIHLNLIVQPTKLGNDQLKVSYRNMRGSVAIEQAIDQAFIFYRVPDQNNVSCVELEACRHKLAKKGKKIYLEYDPDTTRMLEVELQASPPVTMTTTGADYSIE
jgi:KaiC/GvpD/RAD55 family RecA-like ATPase